MNDLNTCPVCKSTDTGSINGEMYFVCHNEHCQIFNSWIPAKLWDAGHRAKTAEDVLDRLIDIIREGKYIELGTPTTNRNLMNWYQRLTSIGRNERNANDE